MIKNASLLSGIQKVVKNNKIGIVGACFDKGQTKDGVQLGPKALRDADLITTLREAGFDVKDYGDIHTKESPKSELINNLKCKNAHIVAQATYYLRKKVIQCLNDDRLCLTLGGDHSVGIGSLSGHFKVNPNLAVLWVDAHADINTDKTSPSGNIHGMPLSFLVQGIDSNLSNSDELSDLFKEVVPFLDKSSLAYIALRDLDTWEKVFLDNLDIKYYTMDDIDRLGIREITRLALQAINPNQDRPLHVSFDVDSIDPIYAPSTGTPVSGGLTVQEAKIIGEIVRETKMLRSLDLAELNPTIGTPSDIRKTLETAITVIMSFLDQKSGDGWTTSKQSEQSSRNIASSR